MRMRFGLRAPVGTPAEAGVVAPGVASPPLCPPAASAGEQEAATTPTVTSVEADRIEAAATSSSLRRGDNPPRLLAPGGVCHGVATERYLRTVTASPPRVDLPRRS